MGEGFSGAGEPQLAVRPVDADNACHDIDGVNADDGQESGGIDGNEGEDEDTSMEDEEEHEAAKPRIIKDPGEPSAAEREEHDVMGHVPYRSWCAHCVRGGAVDQAHRTREAKSSDVPIVGMDYAFMNSKDDDDSKATPILVIKCSESGAICSHLVPQKGTAHEWIVDRVIAVLENLGYGKRKVIIKCDQEPAIVDLQKKIIKKRENVIPENSPVGDSQSNGLVERAIQSVKKQVRIIKDALDHRLGSKLAPNSTVLLWLIEYARTVVSRYGVGKDGKTAYQRIRGNRAQRPMAEFGEQVLFKLPKTGVIEAAALT